MAHPSPPRHRPGDSSSPESRHQHRRVTISDSIRAAVDSRTVASGLSQKLKNAKLLHAMLQKKQKEQQLQQQQQQLRPKSHEERPRSGASERPFSASSTSVYHRSDIIEEDLPSRRDLLAQVGGAPAETLFFDREIERAALLSDAQLAANPLRSHHLWSKKSLDMFKRMYKYTDNVVPEYGFLQHYCKGDALGVVDTYLTYENSDHIENFTSYWAHFQQRFEIHSKARFVQSEIEPLAMMLARDVMSEQGQSIRPNNVAYTILNSILGHATAAQDHRNTMENANRGHTEEEDDTRPGVGGGASIVHLRATLLGVLKSPEEIEASIRGDLVASPSSYTSPGVQTHVRPLFTAGDLMLTLFELADPKLFKTASIQLFGRLAVKDTTWSPEVNFFRVEYNMLSPNQWSYYRPKHELYLRDADLLAFITPTTCPKAFEVTPMDSSIETTAMKIWVTNFVRNFLGFHDDDSSVLQSAIINVQIVRRIDDGLLNYAQIQKPTKEHLLAQEQKKDDILWQEQIAISQCEISQLVQEGDGYSIHIRVVDVTDVKIANRENIKNQALMLSKTKKARLRRRMRATLHVRSVGIQLANYRSGDQGSKYWDQLRESDESDADVDEEDGSPSRQIGEMTQNEFLDAYQRYFADHIPRFTDPEKIRGNVKMNSAGTIQDNALDHSTASANVEADEGNSSFDQDDIVGELSHNHDSDAHTDASKIETITSADGHQTDITDVLSSAASHIGSLNDSDTSRSSEGESSKEDEDDGANKSDSSKHSTTKSDAEGTRNSVEDSSDAGAKKKHKSKKRRKKSVVEKKPEIGADGPKKDLLSKFIPKHGAVRKLSASELNRKKELGVRLKHGNYANEEVGDFLQLCTALVKNKKEEEADDFFSKMQNEDGSDSSSGDEIKELEKYKISAAKTHYERSKNRREYLQQLKSHEEAWSAKMAELRIIEEMAATRKAQRAIAKNNPAFVITTDLLRGTAEAASVPSHRESSRRVSAKEENHAVVDFQAEIAKRIAASRASHVSADDVKRVPESPAVIQHSGGTKVNYTPFQNVAATQPFQPPDLLPMAYLKRTHQFGEGKKASRRKSKGKKTPKSSLEPSKNQKSSHGGGSHSGNVTAQSLKPERHSIKDSRGSPVTSREGKRKSTTKSKKSAVEIVDAVRSNNTKENAPATEAAISLEINNETEAHVNTIIDSEPISIAIDEPEFQTLEHVNAGECAVSSEDPARKLKEREIDELQSLEAGPISFETVIENKEEDHEVVEKAQDSECIECDAVDERRYEVKPALSDLGAPDSAPKDEIAATKSTANISSRAEYRAKVIKDLSNLVVQEFINQSFLQSLAHLVAQRRIMAQKSLTASTSSPQRKSIILSQFNGRIWNNDLSAFSLLEKSDDIRSQTVPTVLSTPSSTDANLPNLSATLPVVLGAKKPFSADREARGEISIEDQDAYLLHRDSDAQKYPFDVLYASRSLLTSSPPRRASRALTVHNITGTPDSNDQSTLNSSVLNVRKASLLSSTSPIASTASNPTPSATTLISKPIAEEIVATVQPSPASDPAETSKKALFVSLPSATTACISPSRASLVMSDSDFSEDEYVRNPHPQGPRKQPNVSKPRTASKPVSTLERGADDKHRKSSVKCELKMSSIVVDSDKLPSLWESNIKVDSLTRGQLETKPHPHQAPPPSFAAQSQRPSSFSDSSDDGGDSSTDIDLPLGNSNRLNDRLILPAIKEGLEAGSIAAGSLAAEDACASLVESIVDDHVMNIDPEYFLGPSEKPAVPAEEEDDDEVPQSPSPKVTSSTRKAVDREESSCIISRSSNPLVNKTARLLLAASQSLQRPARNAQKPSVLPTKPLEAKATTGSFHPKGRKTTQSKAAEEIIVDDAKFLVRNKEVLANQTGLERAMRVLDKRPTIPMRSPDSKHGSMPKRPGRNIIGAANPPTYRVINLFGPLPMNEVMSLRLEVDIHPAEVQTYSAVTTRAGTTETAPDSSAVPKEVAEISHEANEKPVERTASFTASDGGVSNEDTNMLMDLAPATAPRVIMRTVVRLRSAAITSPGLSGDPDACGEPV